MSEKYPWRTGRSCVYKNYIHLIFVTKYRRNVLSLPMLDRLKKVLEETCNQMDVEFIECNGEDDHIHLMVNCPPKLASLKGNLLTFCEKSLPKS